MDAGRPELVACLDYLREGDLLLVTKIDRLARSTSDLYKIISQLQAKGVEFKVLDDPSIDTTRMNSHTERAYVEFRAPDSDGEEIIATTIFTFRSKAKLSKPQIRQEIVRKTRHALKRASIAT